MSNTTEDIYLDQTETETINPADDAINSDETNENSDIMIPDENDDHENKYDEKTEDEQESSYPHTHKPGTVPALFTYYEGTELRKVLAVSNDCDKLIEYANLLKKKIHEEYLEAQKILEAYSDDQNINSVELFLLFANTYNIIGGVTKEKLNAKIEELKNSDNRIAIKEISTNKITKYEIYYSTDLKTLETVLDENKEVQPVLKIEEILVL